MSYQKLIIVGNLGRDPEMRYTPSGTPVTNFSVATNRKWTNADGTPGEEACWFRVAAWGRMAEVCNQYLTKGRQVKTVVGHFFELNKELAREAWISSREVADIYEED